ncbi:phosphoglucosamine mutase [Alkalitalea saponilacus]|uniref:Phosphomannomutase n=1 Tax=Alkalitalea saponilacus TaxID=889453 RepID=A0A1T5HSI4_9BACT|nr:phosphoglucosamine mutase [Alkalitalea saponilacus]ASB48366.1 phosphoglucosamine mutase [Alkalitalea saponilacus]SKC23597.1 phosphomannomutase [Alkalitalea saponilacus]
MALIKSISGIRGTIGGKPGEGLSPIDVVRFTSAYGMWLKERCRKAQPSVVVGRDARISGEMVKNLVVGSLQGLGINVVHLGLATTPTTELLVVEHNADGGIILTASHNPKQWNALKLLNEKGEFLNAADGERVLEIAAQEAFLYVDVDQLGSFVEDSSALKKHVESVLALDLVDVEAIKKAGFKVAVDCVNSVGGIAIPAMLKALGVTNVLELYCEPNGQFPHNPEPLPEHLTDISELIKIEKADVGFVVDPDVDRLAIISEDGSMFGEEYTLVAVADYVLANTPGNTASNLSSSRALRDVTENHGGIYAAAAVGEVNVVEKMREIGAVIGGEGNGGIIYPASHYGRDALVGMALFLTHLAKSGKKCSELRNEYPSYFMSKNKIELTPEIDVVGILLKVKEKFQNEKVTDIDGVKIDFADRWVHLRKSNTEPIIRIYSEAPSMKEADDIALEIIEVIKSLA